jgi:recombination protein RecA
MVGLAASIVRKQVEATLAKRIPGALTFRPAIEPETISFGIPELDQRLMGIMRGCLTEICGPASSGRTTLMLAAMREVTQCGECCALVDTSNAFDPYSGAANGVRLKNLFVARCATPHPKLTPVDKAIKAVDWIVSDGGFGLVILDLGDIRPELAQKIPLSYWYRFRRAVEYTNSCLVVIEQRPFAKSCAAQVITMRGCDAEWMTARNQVDGPTLLTGIRYVAEVSRSRVALLQRKPPAHASTQFRIATPWAG